MLCSILITTLQLRTLPKILGLAVIDLGLIWLWVYHMDPFPAVALRIIFLVPLVFVLNLIVAGVLLFAKNKEYSKLFLVNSIVSSVILYWIFVNGIDRHQNKQLEKWTFQKADSISMIVDKDTLIGFRNLSDTIKMKNEER